MTRAENILGRIFSGNGERSEKQNTAGAFANYIPSLANSKSKDEDNYSRAIMNITVRESVVQEKRRIH